MSGSDARNHQSLTVSTPVNMMFSLSTVVIFAVFGCIVVEAAIDGNLKAAEGQNPLVQGFRLRKKRTVGIDENVKREVELKTKHGGSLKISKSITYNDGGGLTLLPTLVDSITNNRIRLINQLQNGHGRPYLNQPPPTQVDQSPASPSDFDFSPNVADDSRHVSFGDGEISVSGGLGQVTIGAGASSTNGNLVGVDSNHGSINQDSTSGQLVIRPGTEHVNVGTVTTHVVVPASPPLVVVPVVTGHVAVHPTHVVVPVDAGHVNCNNPSHVHGHHHKDRVRQKLAWDHQVIANRHAVLRSKIQGLRELKAYRHQLLHNKLSALIAAKRAPPCGCVKCCNH